MGYMTKYGTIWGAIPQTAGRVFWVAPSASYTVDGRAYSASDDNDGLSPERAFVTINRAWDKVAANVGDVIVLLPGTHSPSASITADVAGVTMMGLPSGRGNRWMQRTTIGAVTGDQTINITAADIEIAFLNIIPVTTDTAIDISAAGSRAYIHDCSFDLYTPAANVGTIGVEALGAAERVLIENCTFQSDGAQGQAIVATALVDSEVVDCDFVLQGSGTWASVVLCGAATTRVIVRRCRFNDWNGTITAGVDGTGATIANGVSVQDCRFGVTVTVPVDNFDAAEATLVENYDMGVGATDGGALIVAIT